MKSRKITESKNPRVAKTKKERLYSRVSNRRGGRNKWGGWKISAQRIDGGVGGGGWGGVQQTGRLVKSP